METYHSQVAMSLEYLNGKINEPEKNGGLFTNNWHIRAYPYMSFPHNRAVGTSVGPKGEYGIINVYGAVTDIDGITSLKLIGKYGVDKRGKNPAGMIFTTKTTNPGNNWSPTADQILGIENIDNLTGIGDLTEVFPWLKIFRDWTNGNSKVKDASGQKGVSGLELRPPDTNFIGRRLNHQEHWDIKQGTNFTIKKRNDRSSWDSIYEIKNPDGTKDTFEVNHPLPGKNEN
jgi:hypothetical protein